MVVLVHGALGDYRQWAPIGDRLAPHYRVVAVSRRYHWPNTPPSPDASYSYESHRDDLLELLRSFTVPVHLVGHSYGAGIVLLAALSKPRLVRSVVVIEPAFSSVLAAPADGLDAEMASRDLLMTSVRSLARAGRDERAAETLVDWLQGEPGGFTRLSDAVKNGLLDNAKTVGPTFAVTTRNMTCDQLKGLDLPTLVMNGEHTRPYYRRIGEAVASCISEAAVAMIPSSRHMAIVESPQETALLLLEFLRRH